MKTFVATFVCMILAAAAAHAEPPQLNIVVILADDLGYGDVQCYNHDRGKIPTPNIDRLAAQGMRFTDGHSSSSVCSPSRYTILTGRYHWRTRLQKGIVDMYGAPLIAADRLTIAGLAKQHGYHTACIGKWHLGWNWPRSGKQIDFSRAIADGPITRGFDEYFGTDVPNWPPYCFIENDSTVGLPSEPLPKSLLSKLMASQPGPAVPNWKLEQILPTIADRASAYMERRAKTKTPFLLYLPLTAPHTPLAVAKEWHGKSGLNRYADFVMQTDAVVGRTLKTLDDTGIADQTLVIFTSDNGFADYVGAKELVGLGHHPSGPLRGYKFSPYEGGHRIPFIVRWPGVTKPASICGQLVHQADVIATIAEVIGAKLPANAGEDSVSLVPLLQGKDAPVREHAVSCSANGELCLRLGDWKLIATTQPQLYNLKTDLGEQHNLAAMDPKRVVSMSTLLKSVIARGRSTPGARRQNDIRISFSSR